MGYSISQSLTGHQSPVECVTFDAAEENVVAGSASGTIKLWDLEEAKGAFAELGFGLHGEDLRPKGEP